jgi:uncharacterized MnhB-related membrane protein
MIDALLTVTILIFGVAAFRARRLLASALWLAGVSALLSILFYRLGAPQVAVIELSVGAGLVTVLFVFAISVAGDEGLGAQPLVWGPVALVLALVAVVLLASLVMPAPELVAAGEEPPLADIMWQQRGLDMLVQVVLIFSGVLGLLGLLAEERAPLEQPAAAEVVARRERELLDLQSKVVH